MSHTDEHIRRNRSSNGTSNWIYVVAGVLAVILVTSIWIIFPFVLPFINQDNINVGIFGDQYGSLNTLFTGLAFSLLICTTLMQSRELSFQRKELEQTREAYEESTALQAANLSGSLLLPIFQYTRHECGVELAVLAQQWRVAAVETLGEGAHTTLVQRLKEKPDEDLTIAHMKAVTDHLVEKFSGMAQMENTGKWRQEGDTERNEYLEWNQARRKISIVAQQVFQIKTAKLVESPHVMQIAAFADFVSTYKYCCYPLDHYIEKRRRPDAPSYPPGEAFISIYSDEELRDAFY